MTSTDHKLGFPPVAEESARVADGLAIDYYYPHDFTIPYPLGFPNRVVEQGREYFRELSEALNGDHEVLKFEHDDHQPDGTVREAVTDEQILRNVNACMLKLTQAAQLRDYSMKLVERLTPYRSRELVGKIQSMTDGHYVRIEAQNKRSAQTFVNEAESGLFRGSIYPLNPVGLGALISSTPLSTPFAVAIAQSQAEQAVATYEQKEIRSSFNTSRNMEAKSGEWNGDFAARAAKGPEGV